MKDAPVYIASGKFDKIIDPVYGEAAALFFAKYGANILFEELSIKHIFPLDLPEDFMPINKCDPNI
jgi:predicted esterase